VAVLELVDRRHTGRHLHFHADPEREIDAGAAEVHGMTWEDLRGKPKFADHAAGLVEFIRGAEWIIHNAPFDLGFLDAEFARLAFPSCTELAARVIDTLALARDAFPGKRNNLDALCERFGVDNARRSLHGALLDAQLLSEVWLALTRGQQTLAIEHAGPAHSRTPAARDAGADQAGSIAVRVVTPSAEEMAAHQSYLAQLDRDSGGRCVWLALQRAEPAAA
jgi:DNA polymerase-3 subunit epsilon